MQKKNPPYVWVSWITKLMAGENQCEWSAWFRSHYSRYDKMPSDFDSATWTSEHNELLKSRVTRLREDGWKCTVEDQNRFKVAGREGVILAGKPDLLAVRDDGDSKWEARVEDAKTGSPKHSDLIQVGVYMLILPIIKPVLRNRSIVGMVAYKNGSTATVSENDIDEAFKERLRRTMALVSGFSEPRREASYMECKFCDISGTHCPERIDLAPETKGAEGLF